MNRAPQTPRRSIRLDDETWERLERIAERRGLDFGGIPSRSAAIRFLVDNEAKIPTQAKDPEG